MRDFLATALSLAIILGTVWGIIITFIFSIDLISSIGIPQGILYFVSGITFAATYKRIGRAFSDYCDAVWGKIHNWVVWR